MRKDIEQYIEHEVKLRVNDSKFRMLEQKLNFLIGIAITSVILPVLLHAIRLI